MNNKGIYFIKEDKMLPYELDYNGSIFLNRVGEEYSKHQETFKYFHEMLERYVNEDPAKFESLKDLTLNEAEDEILFYFLGKKFALRYELDIKRTTGRMTSFFIDTLEEYTPHEIFLFDYKGGAWYEDFEEGSLWIMTPTPGPRGGFGPINFFKIILHNLIARKKFEGKKEPELVTV